MHPAPSMTELHVSAHPHTPPNPFTAILSPQPALSTYWRSIGFYRPKFPASQYFEYQALSLLLGFGFEHRSWGVHHPSIRALTSSHSLTCAVGTEIYQLIYGMLSCQGNLQPEGAGWVLVGFTVLRRASAYITLLLFKPMYFI